MVYTKAQKGHIQEGYTKNYSHLLHGAQPIKKVQHGQRASPMNTWTHSKNYTWMIVWSLDQIFWYSRACTYFFPSILSKTSIREQLSKLSSFFFQGRGHASLEGPSLLRSALPSEYLIERKSAVIEKINKEI